jgi:NTP pyrophosphatase (non-canonical NTP hydrolase)
MNEFNLIRAWATDRNLIKGSDPKSQMLKLFEEGGELAAAIARSNSGGIVDAIGDMVVVLTILAAQLNITIETCVQIAYAEIKDRKGVMRDGVFIKEETKMTKPVDFTKPLMFRDKTPFTLMGTNFRGPCPVQGYAGDATYLWKHYADGRYNCDGTDSPFDIVNTPEKIAGYVNIYRNNIGSFTIYVKKLIQSLIQAALDVSALNTQRDNTMTNIECEKEFARRAALNPIASNSRELELYRADHKDVKAAGFHCAGELLSAYKVLLAQQAGETK